MAVVVLLVIVIAAIIGVVALLVLLPTIRATQQRLRVDRERRRAEWHLQRLTQAAMQRLLEEARRQS